MVNKNYRYYKSHNKINFVFFLFRSYTDTYNNKIINSDN